MKKIFLFLIFVLAFSVSAEWENTGHDLRHSYIVDGSRLYYSSGDTMTISASNPTEGGLVEPLIADLDGDGVNEIIIIDSTEIKLYHGSDYTLLDSYSNATITPSGDAVAYDWDNDGLTEIIFNTNTVGSTYAFFVMEYNGSEFSFDTIYNNTEASNGITCADVLGNSTPDCFFISTTGNISYFNHFTSPTNKISLINDDCAGMPVFIFDVDADNDKDLLIPFGSSCDSVLQYLNTGGVFSLDQNYSTNYGVNQIMMADVDGGTKEIVITDSRFCSSGLSNGCDTGSSISLYNPLSGAQICTSDVGNGYTSPYLTGLHTCYNDEGGLSCDYDEDGFNEIYLFAIYPKTDRAGDANKKSQLLVFDSCSLIKTYTVNLFNNTYGSGYTDVSSTSLYGKAVWENFDSDISYELLTWAGIINKDGTILFNITSYPDNSQPFASSYSKLVTGDVTGDGSDDILRHRSNTIVKLFSFDYDNYAPVITEVSWRPINPVCAGENVEFTISFSDTENDAVQASVRCYGVGNTTNVTSSYTASGYDITLTCNYPEEGDYRPIIYIWDTANKDLDVSFEYGVDVEDSAYCHTYADGSTGNSVIGTTDEGYTGVAGSRDMATSIADTWSNMGLKSSSSRMIIGSLILIVVLVTIMGAAWSYGINIGFGALSIVGVFLVIFLVAIGLFPSWIIALVILIVVALAGLKMATHVSGGA